MSNLNLGYAFINTFEKNKKYFIWTCTCLENNVKKIYLKNM